MPWGGAWPATDRSLSMSATPSPVLCLASASPRRRELLASIGVPLTACPVDIDETPIPGESAEAYVTRLAREKALAGARLSSLPTLGSDTAVVLRWRDPRQARGAGACRRHAALARRARAHGCSPRWRSPAPPACSTACVATTVAMREISDARDRRLLGQRRACRQGGGLCHPGTGGGVRRAHLRQPLGGGGAAAVRDRRAVRRQGVALWDGALG